MMAGTQFKIDMSPINKGVEAMGVKMRQALLMYMTTKAAELEGKMKTTRPWVDRTGMAKQTLTARVSQPSQTILRITCAHGVDYGIWLELAHGKNWAIVAPTIREEAPKIVQGLGNIMQTRL